ncbi:MAG: hypothetical protein ABI183_25705 [Polyangiaceae bacterium]
MTRFRSACAVAIAAFASSACAAILGIDDVSVHDDAGATRDATTTDGALDATASDAAFCNIDHPHDLCADFEEGNPQSVFGVGGHTVVLGKVVDAGTLGLATPGNASNASLLVSTNASDVGSADAAVEESALLYADSTIGTQFLFDFDVQNPTGGEAIGGGHVDYPILQVNDPDGGPALQFYLALNASTGSEIVAVNTRTAAAPTVVPTSTFPDQTWMHVEMRISLISTGSAKMLAFVGNGATTAVFNQTLVGTPVQGRAHLLLGLVTSGNTPTTTLQIDNVTLDTND